MRLQQNSYNICGISGKSFIFKPQLTNELKELKIIAIDIHIVKVNITNSVM